MSTVKERGWYFYQFRIRLAKLGLGQQKKRESGFK
jgi:hypothetical protein